MGVALTDRGRRLADWCRTGGRLRIAAAALVLGAAAAGLSAAFAVSVAAAVAAGDGPEGGAAVERAGWWYLGPAGLAGWAAERCWLGFRLAGVVAKLAGAGGAAPGVAPAPARG